MVVTGGSGRFAQSLKKIKSKYNFIYPSKNKLNITNTNSIISFLKKTKDLLKRNLLFWTKNLIELEEFSYIDILNIIINKNINNTNIIAPLPKGPKISFKNLAIENPTRPEASL